MTQALSATPLYSPLVGKDSLVHDSAWLEWFRRIDALVQASSLSGALLSVNNLSDVASVGASRHSLGLGTADSPSFAGLTLSGLTPSLLVVTDSSSKLTTISFAALAAALSIGGTGNAVVNSLTIDNLTGILRASSGAVGTANIGSSLSYSVSTLDTIQDIRVTASPAFVGLTLTSFSGILKAAAGIVSGSATEDDIADGTTYKRTHNDFTDTFKGYLDQSVKQVSSPTFNTPIVTGLNLGGTTRTTWPSGSPGGSDTYLQYNKASAFYGDADLTWDYTNKIFGLGGYIAMTTTSGNATSSYPLNLIDTVSGTISSRHTDIHVQVASSAIIGDLLRGIHGDLTLNTGFQHYTAAVAGDIAIYANSGSHSEHAAGMFFTQAMTGAGANIHLWGADIHVIDNVGGIGGMQAVELGVHPRGENKTNAYGAVIHNGYKWGGPNNYKAADAIYIYGTKYDGTAAWTNFINALKADNTVGFSVDSSGNMLIAGELAMANQTAIRIKDVGGVGRNILFLNNGAAPGTLVIGQDTAGTVINIEGTCYTLSVVAGIVHAT